MAAKSAPPAWAASVRQGLDEYGHLVQISTVTAALLFAIYRQLSSSSKTTVAKPRAISKTNSILGEPVSAVLAVSIWIATLVAIGILYIPSRIDPEIRTNYIYLTRLPVQLLASLLPFHVLISNSSPINPLPYLFSISRASLIPYHRALGWSFMLLFATHGSMYTNFYLQKGILLKRIQDSDVQLGLALSTTFSTVAFASRKVVRVQLGKQWVWGHISAALAIGTLLWFHVVQTRAYVVQAAVVAAVGVGWRVVRLVGRLGEKNAKGAKSRA